MASGASRVDEALDDTLAPALVHDYLLVMRGAERTFATIADCWPDAPIYTLLYDEQGTSHRFAGRSIKTSLLQRANIRQGGFRRLLPAFPYAVGRLRLDDYKLVVSSSSAFAHGVPTSAGAVHVCYCHSPFRYAWHERARALGEAPKAMRPVARRLMNHIRRWDVAASNGVTHYIANSEITRQRIAEFWGREASIIHPPVDVHRFSAGFAENFFLVVSELVSHKQVELALEAARRAGRPIKVVGSGPDLPRLAASYSASAEFLGRVSDAQLTDLYAHARALIVPNVEEFGIAAVEAQAAGRPVVGADGGGVRETTIDGKTGTFFPPGDADCLAEVLRYFDFDRFEPARIQANALRFSRESFQARLMAEVGRIASGVAAPAFDRIMTPAVPARAAS